MTNTNGPAAQASPQDALTVAEVATELRASRHSVMRAIKDGRLVAYSLSGERGTRVDRTELDRFKLGAGRVRPSA
jgi:excisionase family DNA binding protein